jgi:hypothetical protein
VLKHGRIVSHLAKEKRRVKREKSNVKRKGECSIINDQ